MKTARRKVRYFPERMSLEALECRVQLSAAFDLTSLTALRANPIYSSIDGSGVGVAVLDTGVYASHPHISSNFVAWHDATPQASPTPVDPQGHGTHVSGTVASSNADIGVAPRARLIGVRVLGAEGTSDAEYDTVAAGLRWVLEHRLEYNIRVVNMSLGIRVNTNNPETYAGELQTQYIRLLEAAGVTVVTASGNSYAQYLTTGAAFPAVVSTINVGSVWEDGGVGDKFPIVGGGYIDLSGQADTLSTFLQRSLLPNQVFAPGQTIFSTWNGAGGNLYNTNQGTSMAAPFVSGLVALMQDAALTFGGRYLQPSEVLSVLRDTADFIVDSNNNANRRFDPNYPGVFYNLPETGQVFRRVNALNAVSRVRDLVRGGTGTPTNLDLNKSTATATYLGDC